jgi:diacylglycerol kinase family enzyme
MDTKKASERPLHVLIVANPGSGRGRGAVLAGQIERLLDDEGVQTSLCQTRSPGDARTRVHALTHGVPAGSRGADVVVCIGGDGTANEVANGLYGSPAPLVLVPTGTANILAGEFGFSADPQAAVRTVLFGSDVPLDAGRHNDRVFLCVAGVGFDAEVARRYGAGRRHRGGYLGYFLPLLRTFLGFRPPGLEVSVDDRPYGDPQAWALVSNTQRYGGPLRFSLSARPDNRTLEACLARDPGRLSVLRYLLAALLGRFPRARGTRHITGRRVVVRPLEGLAPVQVDGDFAGCCTPLAPAEFQVLPAAFRLRIPPPGEPDPAPRKAGLPASRGAQGY